MRSCQNERRNQLPPVLAKHSYLYRPLLAVVLAPDGLSRLSCFLCGVGGAVVAYYNEIDPHAAQHLRNLIDAGHIAPGVVDTRSIEDVTPNDLIGFNQCHFFAGIGGWSLALRRAGWPDSRPAWTASCPCQPFSAAGKGLGFADERHLWPSAHWLVGQRRPVVVFGEQSGSADANDWIDLVQADVEALGYAFGAVAFPSASVGAPHQRDRAYWVADADRQQWEGRGNFNRQGVNLQTAALLAGWPTPTATDGKGGYQGGRIRNGKLSTDRLDVAAQLRAGRRQPRATTAHHVRKKLCGRIATMEQRFRSGYRM
jgi:DNA (cytosine-5)-methyltransferase 1